MALSKTLWQQIVDLVSTGHSVSDQFDVAFSNIDDAIDQIDTNTSGIATLSNPDKIALQDVTGNAPAHLAGQMYYADGVLKFQDEYPDVTLSIGREMHIEVVNNTGVTIPNGKVVRQHGVIGGELQVALALADTFETSRILGLTTMDIPDGEKGIVTSFGFVNDMDTSAFSIGVPLYLSDVDAGEMVLDAPDIATQIGGAFNIDATTGVMFVKVRSTIALPTIFASLSGGTAGTSFIADAYQLLGDFTASSNVVMNLNTVLGSIEVPTTGQYKFTTNLLMNFDTIGNTKEDLYIGIFDNVTGLIKEVKDFLPKDSEAGSFYPSFIFDAVADRTYHIEVKCSYALQNVAYSLAEFDITSVHIR